MTQVTINLPDSINKKIKKYMLDYEITDKRRAIEKIVEGFFKHK